MRRNSTIQDYIDALGMAGLLVSIDNESPCKAVMAYYTDPEKISSASKKISGITYNSAEASRDCLFVCKGMAFREEYLDEAIKKGAACFVKEVSVERSQLVCDIEDTEGIETEEDKSREAGSADPGHPVGIFVSDIRKAMPVIAETFYGKLTDKLRVIGITGTKGKSTTAFFLRNILDDYLSASGGRKVAICSGIENYDGISNESSVLTTPEIMEIYRHMDNSVKSGIDFMVIEVSSQALKYDRVSGIDFEAAAFLNIGNDHISDIEHPDFDDYFESKLRIFEHCGKAAYNIDCEGQERIKKAASGCRETVTFSLKNEKANVYAYEINDTCGKVDMRVRCKDVTGYENFDRTFSLGTFGSINAENALAAIALAVLCGIPPEYIGTGLARTSVPGRMEAFYSEDGKRVVIVDYAHNGLSFDRFFESVKTEFPQKKIIAVFGATGTKGIVRRKEMGASAGRNCSYSIITEDDPGYEDIEEICGDIAREIESRGGRYEIITDRTAAVRKGIEMMDDDTLLFVAGKGRERGQKRGSLRTDSESDVDIVLRYLH